MLEDVLIPDFPAVKLGLGCGCKNLQSFLIYKRFNFEDERMNMKKVECEGVGGNNSFFEFGAEPASSGKGPPEKDDFIVRLQEEKNELATKKYMLNEFLGSGKVADVSDIQKDLLKRQFTAMTEYYACLNLRLYDLEQNKDL